MSEDVAAQTNTSDESVEDKFYPKDEGTADEPEKKADDAAPKDEDGEKPEASKDEGKSEDDSGEKKDAKDSDEKPEKYEFEVDDDEPITDEQLEKIAEYAKKQGLSQEQAQEIVDIQSKALQDFQAQQKTQIEEAREQWKAEVEQDKEIAGSSKEDFNKNLELSKRVVDRFGTQQFKDELNKTGLGDHPELLRVFTRIGKAMGEDSLVLGDRQTVKERTDEEIFYGS